MGHRNSASRSPAGYKQPVELRERLRGPYRETKGSPVWARDKFSRLSSVRGSGESRPRNLQVLSVRVGARNQPAEEARRLPVELRKRLRGPDRETKGSPVWARDKFSRLSSVRGSADRTA
jgi:hypothetical protein